jgi:chaperonin cofactor prefoldin
MKHCLLFSESSHLEQQLEEANSVRRELDDAFRQIKAYEKQIKTLQQEREELNKVKINRHTVNVFSEFLILFTLYTESIHNELQ